MKLETRYDLSYTIRRIEVIIERLTYKVNNETLTIKELKEHISMLNKYNQLLIKIHKEMS